MIDLHIHTTYSDGSDTPLEILNKAIELDLKQIAITDHNCVDGAIAARKCNFPIDIIIGCELSCFYKEKEVHLLGYFLEECDFQHVRAFIEKGKKYKVESQLSMINKLNELGIDISYQEVINAFPNAIINRVHICNILMQKGVISSVNEGFERYLGNGKCCYVSKICPALKEGIEAIHNDHGICVLAHPFQYTNNNMEEYLQEALPLIDGIEVYHSSHTVKQKQILNDIAIKYNKIITGGSDYHGTNKPDIKLGGVNDEYKIRKNLFK